VQGVRLDWFLPNVKLSVEYRNYNVFTKLYDPIVWPVISYEAAIWGHKEFTCIPAVQNHEVGSRGWQVYSNKLPAVITSLDSTLYHCHQQGFSPKYRRIVFFNYIFFWTYPLKI